MQLSYTDPATQGVIHYSSQEATFQSRGKELLTLALNTGPAQEVLIDGTPHTFPAWSILPLFGNQVFSFADTETLAIWQYNRDFYCIVDHDREVSCVGFLFFGSHGKMFIRLDAHHQQKITTLQHIFEEEFDTRDNITTDMLRMLLKRLIIITTRLGREQYLPQEQQTPEQFDALRQFNFLVEQHFKKQHQVKFYADMLNRSPKTLSNLFSLMRHKSPLQIIHERIILEAKRLFMYTDKSAKEIAYELGFEDAAHFSRFFKNHTDRNPSSYRKQLSGSDTGSADDTLVL